MAPERQTGEFNELERSRQASGADTEESTSQETTTQSDDASGGGNPSESPADQSTSER